MFWRFGGYANISTIDTILDKPDFTLEEVLDESDLIQELKQHNSKLIEYLRDESVLQRLLAYVIAPPLFTADEDLDDDEEEEEEDDIAPKTFSPIRSLGSVGGHGDRNKAREREERAEREDREKTRQKYAFVASEILSSETWSILESLIENQTFLRQFWEFARKEAPLDPATATYFTKINETLLDKKTEEMLDFIKSLPGIVPSMLRHVDCPMILDLLLKIISMEKIEGGQGIVDWLQTQDLIPLLLGYLREDQPTFTQTSAGDFIKAIITISANASQNEQSCIGPNSLTRQLVSESCVNTLITNMLKGGNPLTVGVGIIIEVIRKNNSDYDPEIQAGQELPPSTSDPIYLGTLLRLFAKHVTGFMELILSPNHTVLQGEISVSVKRKALLVASGESIEPLGFDRFKTCELMAELLHCSNMGLLNEKGSEAHISQRDKERERLRAEGSLSRHREPHSAITEFSEDGSSFETDALDNNSPRASRRLEVTNSAEDDGFEDVGRSEDIPNESKDAFDTGDEDSSRPRLLKRASSRVSLEEEFFDEPLESPKKAETKEEHVESPTTAVASRVGGLDLTRDDTTRDPGASAQDLVNEIESQLQPAVDNNKTHLKPGDSHDGALSTSPLSMSPNPNDTPAPLFAPRTDDAPEAEAEGELYNEGTEAGQAQEGEAAPPFVPHLENDIDGRPIVGDYLKQQFVDYRVVPTILDFFFRFPWNNFLHNVVYDVVQQVFNGPMDRGFNRHLAFDLFQSGRITERIIEGQQRSDAEQARSHTRLGYMGHLTLLAEEVVKFSERYPPDVLSDVVLDHVTAPVWSDYVEITLNETRERDNAILGGVKPDAAMGPRAAVLNAVNAAQGYGNTGSSALANAGLNGGAAAGAGGTGLDSMDLSSNPGFMAGGSLLSGFGSSSDEDDEEMEETVEDGHGAIDAQKPTLSIFNHNPSPSNDSPTASTNEDPSAIPSIPPPLHITPSRARRQLAARLAMQQAKKSIAAEHAQESSDNTLSSPTGDETASGSQPNNVTQGTQNDSQTTSIESPSTSQTHRTRNSGSALASPSSSPLDALLAAAARDPPSSAALAAIKHADQPIGADDPWGQIKTSGTVNNSARTVEAISPPGNEQHIGFEDSFTVASPTSPYKAKKPTLDPAWEPHSRSSSDPSNAAAHKRNSASADWVDFDRSSSSGSSDGGDGNDKTSTAEWTKASDTGTAGQDMGWDTPPRDTSSSASSSTQYKWKPDRGSSEGSDTAGEEDEGEGEDVPLSISMSPQTQMGTRAFTGSASASGGTHNRTGSKESAHPHLPPAPIQIPLKSHSFAGRVSQLLATGGPDSGSDSGSGRNSDDDDAATATAPTTKK